MQHGRGPGSRATSSSPARLPPAPTGIATYDRAVLDGLERIGLTDRLRMDTVWPVRVERRRTLPRISPRRLPAREQRRVPPRDLPGGLPHERPRRAARPRARRLRAGARRGGGSARVHGGPRGGAACAERLSDARRRAQRAAPRSVVRSRRPAGARRDRALGVRPRGTSRAFGCRTPVFVVPHPVIEAPDAIARAGATALASCGRASETPGSSSSRPAT